MWVSSSGSTPSSVISRPVCRVATMPSTFKSMQRVTCLHSATASIGALTCAHSTSAYSLPPSLQLPNHCDPFAWLTFIANQDTLRPAARDAMGMFLRFKPATVGNQKNLNSNSQTVAVRRHYASLSTGSSAERPSVTNFNLQHLDDRCFSRLF